MSGILSGWVARMRGHKMPRKRYLPEEIIQKRREVEVLLWQGKSAGEASRQIGVTEQTDY